MSSAKTIDSYTIRIPEDQRTDLSQDKECCILTDTKNNTCQTIKFHEYDKIYSIPGLYERLFYNHLRCNSPNQVAEALNYALNQSSCDIADLRVFDFGAGNGIMGETLKKQDVSCLVGVDIIPEAYEATLRDRPGIYDAYYIQDVTSLSKETRQEISNWKLDCLVTVGALGFGDIPTDAFVEALNIIHNKGWVAFNIKESFLDHSDKTGFSTLIRELIFSNYIDMYQMQRYCHRLSVNGEPIFYFAISAKKNADVPQSFLKSLA